MNKPVSIKIKSIIASSHCGFVLSGFICKSLQKCKHTYNETKQLKHDHIIMTNILFYRPANANWDFKNENDGIQDPARQSLFDKLSSEV